MPVGTTPGVTSSPPGVNSSRLVRPSVQLGNMSINPGQVDAEALPTVFHLPRTGPVQLQWVPGGDCERPPKLIALGHSKIYTDSAVLREQKMVVPRRRDGAGRMVRDNLSTR